MMEPHQMEERKILQSVNLSRELPTIRIKAMLPKKIPQAKTINNLKKDASKQINLEKNYLNKYLKVVNHYL